jgi:hypothetical protein
MRKEQALTLIKTIRDLINDCCDDSQDKQHWVNDVCFHLDAASDVIEFPKVTS